LVLRKRIRRIDWNADSAAGAAARTARARTAIVAGSAAAALRALVFARKRTGARDRVIKRLARRYILRHERLHARILRRQRESWTAECHRFGQYHPYTLRRQRDQ